MASKNTTQNHDTRSDNFQREIIYLRTLDEYYRSALHILQRYISNEVKHFLIFPRSLIYSTLVNL